MPPHHTHKQTPSLSQTQNHKAQLANAYNELGKELSSAKLRVVGNYTLGRVIGEGAYGKVRIGTHRLTSTRVAIKQIPKAMSASLTREIHHHRQLHHPHITQMYEVIATESHIWIVSELCCGGELFDYLVEKGRLSEDETRVIFGQLCLAVDYLHSNNIVHRDLKLENVLLDERCRVKLGDFGFTREFERGTLMETFCGTTGYASPEMLQAKKYQGPEVDVWSLGIILYCLLTGTLPFDDDDEDVMRSKIIKGEFEDPVWLSLESRDLMKNILVKDVATRFTIPQILSHSWFTSRKLAYEPDSPVSAMPLFFASSTDRPDAPPPQPAEMEDDSRRSSQGTAPDSSQASSTHDSFSPFIKHQPEIISSTPTTPDETMHDPFESTENLQSTSTSSNKNKNFEPSIHRLSSTSTIRKMSTSDVESVSSRLTRPTNDKQTSSSTPAIEEEEDDDDGNDSDMPPPRRHTPSPLIFISSTSGKAPPPSHSMRTPARTKRRSVSSILSAESTSPTAEKTPTPLALPASRDLDFQTMLSARTPVIFSTPTERHLLSTLALLGFDTAQIVHSVLSNACDASGALWWILQKKDEVKAGLEQQLQQQQSGVETVLGGSSMAFVTSPTDDADESTHERAASIGDNSRPKTPKKKRNKVSTGSQTDSQFSDDQVVEMHSHHHHNNNHNHNHNQQRSIGPKFAIVPPTPTLASSGRPSTPPRTVSPTPRSHNGTGSNNGSNPLLSPSSSTIAGELSVRSYPSTPSGSMKESGSKGDRGGNGGGNGRKARSGSVSIMQRATTALEAAGLVRKKSSEAVREEKGREKERERERSRDAEREREKEKEKRTYSGDSEPRSSHGSGGSSKLTKSPPLKASKEKEKEKEKDTAQQAPSTPPPNEANALPALIGSPWFLADGKEALALSQTQGHSHSQPGTVSHMPTVASEMIHSHSTPNFSDTRPLSPSSSHSNSNVNSTATPGKATAGATAPMRNIGQSKPVGANAGRNRANLLTAFRLWFNEDRKGKRKEAADNNAASGSGIPTLNAHHRSGTVGRRGSTSKNIGNGSATGATGNKFGGTAAARTTPRPQRPSMSSRRSSSVNSRRSSVGTAASVHMLVLDSPQVPTRPSFGSHTPNSERGEHSSRPSSIRSVSMQPRHRKSPSQSSAGSIHLRTASPMQQKYHSHNHRRAGSGSSTRVVRQMAAVRSGGGNGVHKRSNSAASSVHSPTSSRPTSWYEPSESEGPGQKRTASPYKTRGTRRSLDDGSGSGSAKKSSGGGGSGSAGTTTTFVAQKRQGPFQSPATSSSGGMITRSSWKKSWGIEPPGWSSRTAHLPIEVLAISPATEPTSIRDVFSGKAVYTSLGAGGGDESDWVDEDDDIPVFVGGLGQVGMSLHSHGTGGGGGAAAIFNAHQAFEHKPITLSPAPRGHRSTAKRAGRNGGGGSGSGGSISGGGGSGSGGLSAGSGGGGRQKAGGHSPSERASPLPPDTGYDSSESRPGRRQLPATRSGPAFKHPIQEEDEGEEE